MAASLWGDPERRSVSGVCSVASLDALSATGALSTWGSDEREVSGKDSGAAQGGDIQGASIGDRDALNAQHESLEESDLNVASALLPRFGLQHRW